MMSFLIGIAIALAMIITSIVVSVVIVAKKRQSQQPFARWSHPHLREVWINPEVSARVLEMSPEKRKRYAQANIRPALYYRAPIGD